MLQSQLTISPKAGIAGGKGRELILPEHQRMGLDPIGRATKINISKQNSE
jgi:hypothetical protein